MTTPSIPNRAVFRAQEVCDIAGLQLYVLKGWEAEFPDLGVTKTAGGPRVYRRADLDRVLRLKKLVYEDGLTLAGARKKLGADAADVQVVYVTVDPERDDAAQMRKFLGSFDASFVGGVGTRAQIDAAQKNYGISSTKTQHADGGYSIGHSSSIYFIDRAGRLTAVMPYGHPVDDFVHDLKILLRG